MADPTSEITSELGSLKSEADSALVAIEGALQSEVDLEKLPLVGSSIKSVFDGSSTLHAVESLQAAIDSGITTAENAINAASDFAQVITGDINSALDAAGFAQSALANVDDSGNVTLEFSTGKTVSDSVPLDANLGLSNLSLKTTGSANVNFDYNFNLTLADSASDPSNPYVVAGGSPLTVSASLSAPDFSADANLGFLEFKATDQGSSLNGNVAVNWNDSDSDGKITTSDIANGNAVSTKTTGSATADVHLESDLGNAALPSISADLMANYTVGGTPTVTIDNVAYDFGSFVKNFIDPILADLDPIVKPLQTIIAVLETNITPLSNFPGLGKLMDVAGGVSAWNTDKGDGKVTLLDLIKLAYKATGQTINLVPVVNFINLVQDLIDWDAFLQGKNFGAQSYTLGSFDISNSGLPTLIPATEQDLNGFLANLPTGGGTDNGQTAAQVLQGMFSSNSDFSFPIISNPLSAIGMILGQTTDLFHLNLQTQTGFGNGFNADGSPVLPLGNIVSIPLFGIPFLNAELQGDLTAALNIGFGYDTRGLQEFEQSVQSGTPAPGDIANGFYVTDVINGKTEPLISLTGLGQIALEAGFHGILDASIGGYLEGSLGLDLNAALGTDHKLYLDQITSALASNPFQMFTTSGELSFGFDAEVTTPIWGTHAWEPAPQVLFDLSPSAVGSAPASQWTTSPNGDDGGPPPPPPLTISGVSIAHRANIGDTFTAAGGTPSDNTASVSYQWQRGQHGSATDIAGATGSTYTLTQADLGYDIDVVVTAHRASDDTSASATSNSGEPNLATYDNTNSGQLDVVIPAGAQNYGFFNDSNNGVTIQAFGQSQDYVNVSSLLITGAASGDETLVFDQSLTIPTLVTDSGSGNLSVYATANDIISYTGTGSLIASAAPNDIVAGGSGTNYIDGFAGSDTLTGGSGVNIFNPGPGDTIIGGSGENIVSYALSDQSVNLDLTQPPDQNGNVVINGTTFTNIQTISQWQGSDNGDTMKAGDTAMNFIGGTGNDTLIGGGGDDTLQGGGGSNTLTGNGGDDLFIFGPQAVASGDAASRAYDTVTDYGAGDELIVSGIVGAAAAAGDPTNSLVRIIQDDSGSYAILQVNPEGPSDPTAWTTVAHLEGLTVGQSANVLLTGASPVSVPVQVVQTLYLAGVEVNNTPTYQLMIQQGNGANHVLATLGPLNFNGDSRDYPTQFLQIDNEFYFAADVGPNGNELWASDGTAAGTHLVMDINPGGNPSYPSDFFDYNGRLVFLADDGTHGNQVWVTDGTTTTMLTDIAGGIQGVPALAGNPYFENLGGTLYFTAMPNSTSDNPYPYASLYQSDGTPGGTFDVIAAQTNGIAFGNDARGLPVLLNGDIIFPVGDRGVNESTMEVAGPGVTFGSTSVSPQLVVYSVNSDAVVFDGAVYYTSGAFDGKTLFASNGTSFTDDLANNVAWPAVPLLVSLANGDGDTTRGYNIANLTPDSQTGELFFTSDNFDLVSGTVYQNPVYSNQGSELWVSDGTAEGTHRITDLNTQPLDPSTYPNYDGTSNQGSNPKHLTVTADGTLYFSADDGVSGEALYKYTDGGGVMMLQTFDQNASNNDPTQNVFISNADDDTNAAVPFFVDHNSIYFTAKDSSGNLQLWTSNGDQTIQLTNATDAPNGVVVSDFYKLGDQIYFGGFAPGGGTTSLIWKTDGTAAGTKVASVLTTSGFPDPTGQFAAILSSTNYAAVNHAPTGSDSTVGMAPYSPYDFYIQNFAFSDPDGNNLAAVKITSLPAVGSLTDNGVAVTAGQVVSAADIRSQKLEYTAVAGSTGTSFTFQVQDDGGTANGGVDTDPTPRTMTINVDNGPQLSNVAVAATYIGSPLILSPQLTVIADTTTLADASVTLSDVIDGDVLSADTTGTNITANYTSDPAFGFGELDLIGNDTIADYEKVLDSVTFSFTGSDPTAGDTAPTRTAYWGAYDGVGFTADMPATTINIGSQSPPVPVGDGDTVTVQIGNIVANFDVENGGTVVIDGGKTVDATVESGGTLIVQSGGVADPTVVSSGGSEVVSSGGTDLGALLSGGIQFVLSGGSASGTVVLTGGEQYVGTSGTSLAAQVQGGGAEVVFGTDSGASLSGTQYDFATASGGTTLNGGYQLVAPGAVASGMTIELGGQQYVGSGGMTLGAQVAGGGAEVVFGTDSGANLSGTQYLYGTADGGTTFNGGYQLVAPGATASGMTVSSGGYQYIGAGGTALATNIAAQGAQEVFGSALETLVSGTQYDFAYASGGTTFDGGFQLVAPSAVALAMTVESGGQQYIGAGGTALATDIESQGAEVIFGSDSGALVRGTQYVFGVASGGTTFDGGSQQVQPGGTAIGMTVSSLGLQNVGGGGTAIGTQIMSQGAEIVHGTDLGAAISGTQYVLGLASGTVVDAGGYQVVSAGGTISGASISGGTIEMMNGAANGTAPISFTGAGELILDASTTFSGTVAGFGTASLNDTIDFADIPYVSAGSAGATTIGWSQLTSDGNPSGTLTVSQGGHSADITLLGQYMVGNFTPSDDGHGGTLITDPPVTAAAYPNPPALAMTHHG